MIDGHGATEDEDDDGDGNGGRRRRRRFRGSRQDHGWLYQEYLACVFSRWYPHNKVTPQMCSMIPLRSWHRPCVRVSLSSSLCALQEKEQLSCGYPPAPAGKGHGCVMWLNKFVKSVWNFLAFYGRDGLFLSLFFLPPFLHLSAPEIWQGYT